MNTEQQPLSQLRLLQFLSPALPVGSYSYSQGLEWAVERGWITDEADLRFWMQEQIATTLAQQELPLLIRLYQAVANDDTDSFDYWSQFAYAIRETAELRSEEQDRARAYLRVLESVDTLDRKWSRANLQRTPLASMALFCCKHHIAQHELLPAYAHNWLEANLITGIKVIPLGQSSSQRLLFALSSNLLAAIDTSLQVSVDCVGISLPAFNKASCGHELQYCRIYRS